MERICTITGKAFRLEDPELALHAKFNELNQQFKLLIPLPDLHPLEDLRRAVNWVNMINLHRTKSALSGKSQLTRYDPSLGTKIVTADEYWSDAVDNLQFGREYDFKRPFFEQWLELYKQCYILPLTVVNAENSDYVNGANNIRDCYLSFHVLNSSDCLYSFYVLDSSDIVSSVGVDHCQFCYHCLDIEDCYECQDCQDCKNCTACIGSLDLIGCRNCFGCVGLRNAEYHAFNERLGKEKYREFLNGLALDQRNSRTAAINQAAEFIRASGHRVNRCINVEDSSGNYLLNCKNVTHSYFAHDCEDCSYVVAAHRSKSCVRSFVVEAELAYRTVAVLSYNDMFGYANSHSKNLAYSFICMNNCSDCFGCVALKRKQYCILNKQYSREEYFSLLPRIAAHMESTGEWGKPFPVTYAPYYYEHSCVSEYFDPLEPAEAKRRGYRLAPPPPDTAEASGMLASMLPEQASEISESLLGKQYICTVTQQGFNLQRRELDFHVKNSIPLSTVHWRERIRNLIRQRELVPAI